MLFNSVRFKDSAVWDLKMNGKLVQLFATFVVSLGNFFASYSISWTSVALTVLLTDDSPIGKITKDQGNLVGSVPTLGSIISTFIGSWLSDKIGRKRTTILGGLFFVLSWSLIITAPNLTFLLIGRFINGAATGIHFVVMMPFVSEFAEISIRGTLMSIVMMMYSSGMLVAYLFGWFFSYDVINYINLTFSTAFVVLVSFLKETPAFLVSNGKDKAALKSLQFYRGVNTPTEDILSELKYLKDQKASNKMQKVAKEEKHFEPEKENLSAEDKIEELEDVSAWKFLWHSPAYTRALLFVIINITLVVLGGTVAIAAYATQLFTEASPTLSPQMCSVMLAVAFVVGGFIPMFISDLVGRRALMMTSGVLSSACLATLASQLHWSWGPTWLVPAAILAYCCVFQLGLANVPVIQIAEIFPPKLKSLTSMIILTLMGVTNFLVLLLFGPTVSLIGLDGAFLAFSVVCMVSTAQAFFFMKETRGVPQEEIERMYEEGFLYRRRKSL